MSRIIRKGVDALRAAILREIDTLPGLRDVFPTAWFAIKDQLSAMPENSLTFDRHRALCEDAGENDHDAQNTLAGLLHSLGIALNYRDDPRLHDLNVLNPRWVTDGVYKILNHEIVARQKGELAVDDIGAILDSHSYPRERHAFLLELMRKFELCFRFADDDERYLIPQLLPKEQPDAAGAFHGIDCLSFEYHYPTLVPEGLLPRFIVRTYVLSAEEPRWRSGVIVSFEDCRALVVADPVDRRVRIRIEGPVASRGRLLAVIRNDFDRIHAGYRFKPKAMIGVPDHPELFVPYEDMAILEARGVQEMPQVASGKVLMLSVKPMLDSVDIEGSRRSDEAKQPVEQPVRAFVSYSHKDERLRAELDTHLKLFSRTGKLDLWTDRRIGSGTEWKGQIDENLERADLILLLVSADFMGSDYCYDIEMTRALERHDANEARVVPIIVRQVAWHSAKFGKLQALPANGKVVDRGTGGRAARDAAWAEVARNLEQTLREIAESRAARR